MDQIELTEFLTPVVGAGVSVDWDLTAGGITEPTKAAVLLYSASDADDTDHPSARVGITLVSSESTNKVHSNCVLARDALAAPDARTAVGARACYVPRVSAFPTQFDQDNSYQAAISGGFRFRTTIDPLVRSRGAALILAGTGMRSWSGSAEATTTQQDVDTGPLLPTDQRFRPHLLIVVATRTSGTSGQIDDAAMGVGFVVDDGGPTQVCAFTDWADATEPSDTDGELRSDAGAAGLRPSARGTRVLVTFEFTSTGFKHQASADDLSFTFLAVRFEAGAPGIYAGNHELNGSTSEPIVLPFDPHAVLALSSLLGGLDTPVSSSDAGAFGLSLFGPSFERAYSARMKQGESTSSDASFRQEAVAVLTLDHLGAVARRGTYDGPASPHGFVLDFTSPAAGHLTILALAPVGLVPVDAVELPLVLPAVTIAGLITPSPVVLGLGVPAAIVVLPQQPAPAALALQLPAPTLFTPSPMAVRIPPVLGPSYHASLAALLPRGLAWNRRVEAET